MTETTDETKLPENITIPPGVDLIAHNFAEDEFAKTALLKIHSILSVISQSIDLKNLDGVTLSHNYDKSLADLDRGYETNYVLEATKDVAIGVAMAPSVIRDGKLKTHLVLNAPYVLNLLDEPGEETDFFWQALHLVAHECAHVEVTEKFDVCFPEWLLRKSHDNILDNLRWQVILAAWDEYAVCRITGKIGYDPTDGYLETLLTVLSKTRTECIVKIKDYRLHGDVGQVVPEVYGILGNLIKYSCYYLGANHGIAPDASEAEPLNSEDEFVWFEPFFQRISEGMQSLFDKYGRWGDQELFDVIGDLLEEMAEFFGIFAELQTDGEVYFNIPYRADTMP